MHDVKCVVKNAKPAPTYAWRIGDDELDGEIKDQEVFVDTSGISVFTQTLKYKPSRHHANKTLRYGICRFLKNFYSGSSLNIYGPIC